MTDDPKPEDQDATEQAKEMEEAQKDASKEREENGATNNTVDVKPRTGLLDQSTPLIASVQPSSSAVVMHLAMADYRRRPTLPAAWIMVPPVPLSDDVHCTHAASACCASCASDRSR